MSVLRPLWRCVLQQRHGISTGLALCVATETRFWVTRLRIGFRARPFRTEICMLERRRKTRHLDRLDQLSEFEQDSNTDSQQHVSGLHNEDMWLWPL